MRKNGRRSKRLPVTFDVKQFHLLTTLQENGNQFLILIKRIKETVSGVYLFNKCIIEVI